VTRLLDASGMVYSATSSDHLDLLALGGRTVAGLSRPDRFL